MSVMFAGERSVILHLYSSRPTAVATFPRSGQFHFTCHHIRITMAVVTKVVIFNYSQFSKIKKFISRDQKRNSVSSFVRLINIPICLYYSHLFNATVTSSMHSLWHCWLAVSCPYSSLSSTTVRACAYVIQCVLKLLSRYKNKPQNIMGHMKFSSTHRKCIEYLTALVPLIAEN